MQPSMRRSHIGLMCVVILLLCSCGASNATHTTTRTRSTPTAKPGLRATHGTPLVGGPISDFIGTYGQPNRNSQPAKDDYTFAMYGNPSANDLSVTTERGRALSILLESPTSQGWPLPSAITACHVYLPSDSVYKRSLTIQDGSGNIASIQRVYFSPSLASQFPASDFTDEHGNQTTSGIFGMVLTYGTTTILSCADQVGLQTL